MSWRRYAFNEVNDCAPSQFIFKENIDDANVKNSKLSPWTLLEFAASLGHVDVVNLLLSKIDSDIGPWPLALAAEYGQFQVVKILAPFSADFGFWIIEWYLLSTLTVTDFKFKFS